MGMMMSLVGIGKGGMPQSPQMLNMVTGMLYEKFTKNKIQNFEQFHEAMLDMFNVINSILPGRHYDVPPGTEIKVNLSKLDNATVITGLVTPPAAMAAKKAGENVPQMGIIKTIPDVIFVPSITVLALISSKFYRKVIQGTSTS